MNEDKLRKTVDNLSKGVVAKSMLVKRGEDAHSTHRWIKTRKAGSAVVKMAVVKELILKAEGMGGSPATVASTGFTPTFGGVQSRSVQKRLATQQGLPMPTFEAKQGTGGKQ